MIVNLTKQEREIIQILLKAERTTIRFLTGFGEPTDKELLREKFLDKLINKLYEK